MSRMSWVRPGRSKTSCRHSRMVSRMIGNDPYSDGDLEQVGAFLALLPQGRTLPGPPFRQEQRPGGALPEPAGEQRRAADLGGHQRLDLLGVERLSSRSAGASSASGSRTTMPSSVCMVCTSSPSRERTWPSMASAHGAWTRAPKGEWMQSRQSPSSSRKRSRTIVRSVGRCPVASFCSARYLTRLPAANSSRPASAQTQVDLFRLGRAHLPHERAQRPAQLHRPAERVAVPERHLRRHAGGRGHQHPVVGDLADLPVRGAEREDVADPRLVDHLLVQLAHPRTALAAGQEDAEQPAVGDRPAAGHRQQAGVAAGGQLARRPGPS